MSGFRLCAREKSFSSEDTSGSDVSTFHEHKLKDLSSISISSDLTDPSQAHGGSRSKWRRKAHHIIESKYFRIFVIVLIVLDVIAVSLELAIASDAFGEVHSEAPCPVNPGDPRGEPTVNHDLEHGEEFLHWFSITMLCIFVIENLVLLWAIGKHFFKFMHVFDFGVVLISLVLELWLGGENAYAGLLVLLRLVRIVQGVVAAEQEAHTHTQSRLRHSLNHNKYLRRVFKNFLLDLPDDKIDSSRLYLAKHLLHNSKRFERSTANYLLGVEGSLMDHSNMVHSFSSYSEDKRVFEVVRRDFDDRSHHRRRHSSSSDAKRHPNRYHISSNESEYDVDSIVSCASTRSISSSSNSSS
ncbi:uncharacterized protein AMSG_04083 [Thecamonas trahens ATCC 50062]|uniref:Voltage-gated hydrogen channel 1 n=1 Tax=Thecamonas trahens ATCC 50062 TaxID=461836 RepID=A0A0L0D973_THETB|nr:hypothetical protein AMSG_04083 [Thecamonas trahens ATCC 50062]KNC47853.1 hypothetical protein AMSG_04083 [Thecamonas trahens ATCC 50062]|eukprot:XP_013759331.1 hypothetical protein AMSG_04083 [Thecamonas trahens ATCC 50062]